jgi:hypothetical protein
MYIFSVLTKISVIFFSLLQVLALVFCFVLIAHNFLPVLRIRIRDPVLFDPWIRIRDEFFSGSQIPDRYHSVLRDEKTYLLNLWLQKGARDKRIPNTALCYI